MKDMMKTGRLIALLIAAFGVVSCQPTGAPTNTPANTTAQPQPAPGTPFQNVEAQQFSELMKAPNTVVLDVRTPAETAAGMIEGAIELDVTNPNFAEKVAELDKSKTYLVYCRSGRRSANACQIMSGQGFGQLYNLQGGYLAWPK
jgi:rhodanese-related sulfurtransferase